MKIFATPTFPIYAVTNFALVLLGYEAASSRSIPRWTILLISALLSIAIAFVWSRTLARAYNREDAAMSMFERLLQASKTYSK